ncbi:MAG TPA: 4'-phosphopantetheinyl transferase superfamily protein [Gammaproteobacteria bacterium]|nr:4'-phosphopantetheinyl transferase superfamily protein [Gammaproteobacteria bacterium]
MALQIRERQTPGVTPTVWDVPGNAMRLGRNDVHVWRAPLTTSHSTALYQTLSADERARAQRFHFQHDRQRYIAARGILRTILARYLNLPAQHIKFLYNVYGKPTLQHTLHGQRLCFNLAHSHELAVYAVTMGREIGVDIEYLRPDLADQDIVEQFFSPREVQALRALPSAVQQQAFFNCWTRKEAYIKAIGKGLSFDLNQFDVTLAPDEPAALLNVHGHPEESTRWSLRALPLGPHYAGAIAVEGHDWQLQCRQWPDQ